MKLLNRREIENIRHMLLACAAGQKPDGVKINIGNDGELLPTIIKLSILAKKLGEVYGAEEAKRHINKACDNLSKLSIDKEGKINIDANEFIAMCRE